MDKLFVYCTAPSIIQNKKTVFYKIAEKVSVEAPGKLMRQLIKLCDGTRPVAEVVELLKDEWDEQSIRKLIKDLCQREVLIDCRHLSIEAWKIVENPSRFPSLIDDKKVVKLVEQARQRHRGKSDGKMYHASSCSFSKLLERRRSTRLFSGGPINLQSIIDMLWSAYGEVGENGRTVPSAGALYPLMIHVVLLKHTTEGFLPAIYHVVFGTSGSVGFTLVSEDTTSVMRAFIDPLMSLQPLLCKYLWTNIFNMINSLKAHSLFQEIKSPVAIQSIPNWE